MHYLVRACVSEGKERNNKIVSEHIIGARTNAFSLLLILLSGR